MSPIDLLAGFVDLTIIVVAVAMGGYVLIYVVYKSSRSLPPAAYLIAAGMMIAVAASSTFAMTSPTWLPWLLSRLAITSIAIGLVTMIIGRRRMQADLSRNHAHLEELRAGSIDAEQHFQYLFDTSTDSMYCYAFAPPISASATFDEILAASFDARLQQANEVFVRELENDKIDAVIGQRYGALDSANDHSAHSAMVAEFVQGGYRLENYSLNYETPSGESRALIVNWFGVIQDGMLERIWGVESNVLEFRETKVELEHRRRFEQKIAEISSQLIEASDEQADAGIYNCIGNIGDFFAVDRITLFWIVDESSQAVSVTHTWARTGVAPFDTNSPILFPNLQRRIRDNEVVRIDSVASLPDEFADDRRELMRIDVKSSVVLPLIIGDEARGGMTFSSVTQEKVWTDLMIDDAKVFAKMLANTVLRLSSRRALGDALQGLQKATERLQAENVYLREEVSRKHSFHEIVGESSALLGCLRQVEQVASTQTPVLIYGETGTGKELIARAIHDRSDRRDRPLVKVNCAALPANLIESELFGHEKGAFTGADGLKRGRFDLADGSTLFLDEIGEIPVELQGKLLRVLQEGEFDRIGGTKTIKVDVRLVVATNRDLGTAAHSGEFRTDLYYRINTFPIELPPLRVRGGDIELLARHFVNLHAKRLGYEVREIGSEMMRQLRTYHWPGNVRELEGIIQRALISNAGPIVELAEPLVVFDPETSQRTILSSTIADLKLVEHDHILSVLKESRWKISGESGAAAQLGIPPSTLRSKMKKLGIVRGD